MAKAQATPKALRQLLNERTTEYFAAAVCSLIVLFIICHWSRILYCRFRSRNHRGSVEKLTSHLLRRGHDILCHRLVIGRLSVGRVLLYLTYWAVNLILYPTSVDLKNLVNMAKHCGWIALINVCLVIFLSLKNTPLAILSTSSYDKLMPLHKVSGYTAIVAAWIHAIVYLEAWAQTANLHGILEVDNIAGVMGGIALLLIGVSTLSYVRERLYEAFYIVHIILSTFIIIVVGLHRPHVGQHALIVTCVMASMAFLDKAIRLVRYFVTSMGNHATLTALPNGATRVHLHRSIRSAPGSHAFLWLPAIRLTQSHPFTLVSTNPVEFVVRAHRGFTADLYQYAQKHGQDKKIRCALNGPYGRPTEDLTLYDSVLLVAGGSGASFTFAVGLNLARGISIRENPMRFSFVWVVRTKSCLSWFQQELDELLMSSVVEISIYVTGEQVTEKIGFSSKDRMIISEITKSGSGSGTPVFPPPDNCVDIENKAIATATSRKSPLDLDIKSGRPKVKALVDEFVTNESSPANRVIVGACGPLSLMDAVRATASDYSKKAEGPSVTFYHEEFGW